MTPAPLETAACPPHRQEPHPGLWPHQLSRTRRKSVQLAVLRQVRLTAEHRGPELRGGQEPWLGVWRIPECPGSDPYPLPSRPVLILVSLFCPHHCLGCGSEGQPKRSRPELPLMQQGKSSRGHGCLPLPGAPQACGVNADVQYLLSVAKNII